MKIPLVSIIIPTYNRADYLTRTIKSAVDQSYENCEIIVCDNDSKDHSEEIVRKFISEYPNKAIRYIKHERNIGPVRNWFSGIEAAKGEYIKILFSDDYLYCNCVKDLVTELDKTNYAFSYGIVDNLWQSSSVSSYVRYRPGSEISVQQYIAAFFSPYLAYESYPISPCAALLRKEPLLQIPLEQYEDCYGFNTVDSGIGPDMLMFLYNFSCRGQAAKYVNKKIAAFEGHATSITINSGMEKLDNNNFAAFLRFYELQKDKNKGLAQVIEAFFDRLAIQPKYFKRPEKRLQMLLNASLYQPKEKAIFFPVTGFSFYLLRKVHNSIEFRLKKAFKGAK